MNNTYKTNKTDWRRLVRSILFVALLLGASLPAMATDYVITWTNGGTTYYVGMNGNNIAVKNEFDITCVWTCSNGNNDANLGGTSYSLRNKNNNKYFLTTSCSRSGILFSSTYTWSALTVQNSASNIWRSSNNTNGNVYAYYSSGSGLGSWNRSASIRVVNNAWAMYDNNTTGSQNSQVTTTTPDASSPTAAEIGTLTVTPLTAALYQGENEAFTASASVTVTNYSVPAHTKYTFTVGSTDYEYFYYNNTRYTSIDDFSTKTTTTQTPSYAWTKTGDDGSNATLSSTNAASTTVTHATQAAADKSVTLTVTASYSGAESKTANATVVLYGPMVAPTITRSGNSISIATTNINATIYYTTNGSTPTASSTPYTGSFDLTTSPTTVKAIAIRDGHSSTVTTETFQIQLPAPVITISNSGLATITSEYGATIHYTTDGTTPTAGSPTYSAPVQLTNPQTIKVIAIKSGYDNSAIATADYVVTGVSGTTVILDDREDHNWTYYSGVDNCVDGGNYNTNYLGKLYSPNPRNVKITYNAVNGVNNSTTNVRVSISENETSFIYYKTLEEGTTSGEYPYQVISNPFSVRPSKGTGNSKVYYGFAGWKIVSGGEYIKNHSNGDVLALDEEIVFNNLPYSSVNCISAEIVFQTTWTTANVQTGNNISTMFGNFSGGTYETNFAVLTGQYTTAWTGNKNATITSVYPDGSSDVRSDNNYTRLNVTVNANYTIKYEYININNSNTTFSMGTGTKTLYIGRGVSNTDANGVVCNVIRGYDESINSGGLTYTMKIESGIYNYLSFIKGYDGARTDNTVTGTVAVKGVLGCDYDRAREDNTKLKIQQQIMMGYANKTALLNSTTAGQEVLNVTLKSGNLISSRTDAGTADAAQSFYIGIAGKYSAGYRVFTMEGGEMWSLAAGICNNTQNTNSIRFRIKGGLIKGSIYGSAANANSYGYKQMIITGGTIKGWIAGGGNGTEANGGTTTGSSYIYVGGNARVDSEGSNTKINSSLGGQVFGSGSGVENTTTWGEMLYGSNVVIADNAYIERNVFGGGNFGWTDQYATIYLTGDKMSVGNVYGGANQNKGDNVKIYMTGGTVREGLYGGSNSTGTIQYNVEMHIDGGQVGTNSQNANIHGGGYGSATRVSRNVEITLGNSCNDTEGVTVFGDVYGGSALGYVNGTSANNTYHTYVTLNKGTINGSLYGGGLGNANTAANVYGPVQVKVYGGSVKKTDANGANGSGAVYGCNNTNGAPQRAVSVDIYGTDPAPAEGEYGLFAVYGGGNQANYTGTPNVTVHCGDPISIGDVYGGGNAATVTGTNVAIYGGNVIGNVYAGGNAANVNGAAVAYIYGGTLGRVFAGNNNSGNITGGATVNINSSTETDYDHCSLQVGAVFHGGNQAPSAQQTVNIICTGDATEGIDTLFGGANAANITSDVTLNVTKGNIRHAIFGGNNAANSINGDITVTLGTDASCQFPFPTVFGGGFGANTSSTGDVTVTVGDKAGTQQPTVNGDIYGGSALGSVNDAAADSTIVNIYNGTVNGNVYGGGLGEVGDASKGTVNGVVTVNIGASDQTDGNCHSDLSNCSVYGCNNTNGSPQQNVTVNIYRTGHTAKNLASYHNEADSAFAIDQVFGGGNQADFTPSGKTATVHIYGCNNTIRRVFGGGNAAAATGVVTTIEGGRFGWVFGGGNGEVTAANIGAGGTHLTVEAGRIEHLFGASNANGTITGAMITNVNHDNDGCEEMIREFFGGANLAPLNTSLNTTIACGTIFDKVYGGSKKAAITGNVTLTIEGGTINEVYGGSEGTDSDAANIDGDVTLNIYGGAIGKAFGGSNINGNITGTATVNLDWSQSACGYNHLGSVFGGGNQAAYGGPNDNKGNYPQVNVLNGTVTNHVFGGGLGATAIVYGNPQVTIGDNTVGHTATVNGDVYGGGDAAAVQGTPVVHVINKCNTSINNVYGGGNAADVSATNVTIDGGNITGMVFGGGHGDKNANPQKAANVTGNVTVNVTGGTINKVFGGSNSKGNIGGDITLNVNKDDNSCEMHITEVYGGGNEAAGNAGTITIGCTGSASEGIGDVYGGANAADINSDIVLNITGGQIDNVFGGNNTSGAISGSITVNVNKDDACGTFSVNNVYGGGNLAAYSGTPAVNILKGTVNQKVFGGGNEAGVGGGNVTLAGGNVLVGVYGGCNTSGTVAGDIEVKLNSGTVGTDASAASVFGGGLGASTATTGNVHVKLNGATVYGDIYGGSALGQVNDAAADNTIVDILSGTVNQVSGQHGNIYGGGMGEAGAGNVTKGQVNGTVVVNIGATDGAAIPTYSGSATVGGMVFGCNNTNGSPQADVYVNIYKTAHTDDVNDFGALMAMTAGDDTIADLRAVATLVETPATEAAGNAMFALQAVYGGGNEASYVPAADKKSTVTVFGCTDNTIKYVYGGGRAASSNETHVVIEGGHIYRAFAGGDGSNGVVGANVGYMPDNTTPCSSGSGNTEITVKGGAVYQVFGGSNTLGLIRGSSTIEIDKTCDQLNIAEGFGGNNLAPTTGNRIVNIKCGTAWNDVYGGNNLAPHTGNITLNIVGGSMNRAFGGSKNADISGNVTVNVTGGSIKQLFGGNNVGGNITGTITVNVDCDPLNTCADERYLGTVYGGGKDAAYTPTSPTATPSVNIKCGTVSGDVFGGGLGSTANCTSNPKVLIGGDSGNKTVVVNGNVYGGGSAAPVTGSTTVETRSSNADSRTTTLRNNVYGGGLGSTATVSADTDVKINGNGTLVSGSVYGGGNAGQVNRNTNVEIGEE